MKPRHTALKIAIAALGFGVAQNAAASIYAESDTDLFNLNIRFFDSGGQVLGLVNSFSLTSSNSAILNGTSAPGESESCGGTLAANTCNNASPRLDPNSSNAPGGAAAANRGNNDFSRKGPGGLQYSNSDAVIWTAQLTGDATTRVQTIAETELQTGESAEARAGNTSATNLAFQFTLLDPGYMQIAFDAIPHLHSAISDPAILAATSLASMAFTFNLADSTGANSWDWAPNGVLDNNCGGNLGCVETTDGDNLTSGGGGTDDDSLNANTGAGQDGDNFERNAAGTTYQYLVETGALLSAGTWTLTLSGENVANVTRFERVSEPGILALMGAGLVTIAAGKRRRSRKSA